MLFDWFTVFAQIVNFLILVFLLRRFLYGPIVRTMQERERLIQERIQNAERMQQEAEEERKRYQALNEELRQHFEQKQKEAEEEAQAWRREALHSARQEVEATLQEWRRSVQQEIHSFKAELRRFTVQKTFAVAEKAIRDLADASLEERMARAFLSQIEQGSLDLSLLKHHDGLTIQSAFELSPPFRRQMQEALAAHLGRQVALKFEANPELAAGIEIVAPDGHQIGWNLRRYLESLEEELDSTLQQFILDSHSASSAARA